MQRLCSSNNSCWNPGLGRHSFWRWCVHRPIVNTRLIATKSGNYYAVMGLKTDASDKQIKTAYFELCKQYHPDMARSSHMDELMRKQKFLQITEAYQILSNSVSRAEYDRTLNPIRKPTNRSTSNTRYSTTQSASSSSWDPNNPDYQYRQPPRSNRRNYYRYDHGHWWYANRDSVKQDRIRREREKYYSDFYSRSEDYRGNRESSESNQAHQSFGVANAVIGILLLLLMWNLYNDMLQAQMETPNELKRAQAHYRALNNIRLKQEQLKKESDHSADQSD